MASGAVVVITGYALRLLGVALFGVSSSGTVAVLVVNMLVLVGMVTFVIACSTWVLKVGLKAAR